jgi:HlyD family secretion protein
LLILLYAALSACQKSAPKADAYGNFEADDLIVGAEASGKILHLAVEEGQYLAAGAIVGRIDSAQLALRRQQLQASIRAVAAKSPAIAAQLAVFEKQMNAVRQQLGTLQRQVDVVLEQRSASDAALNTQKSGLLAEILPLQKQIAQIDDQMAKCRIVNPAPGTVLNTYAEPGEVAGVGKALYKIADLRDMTLRAYVAGDQLGSVKTGQTVRIFIDAPGNAQQELAGKVTWISPKAEFTPKVIQTKEERVNLVYAFKAVVPNPDGLLKIGMPAEVKW